MSAIQAEQLFGAKIKFVPEISNDAYCIYAVSTLSGDFIFDVVVSNLTGKIKISFPDLVYADLDVKAATKNGRISSDSVKSLIYPRIISILAKKMAA